MGKRSGGIRPLGGAQMPARVSEYNEKLASGEYDDSYLSPAGGYALSEKSNGRHSEEEWEAAIALADNGYRVILKNEDGTGATEDGKIISIGTYEQRTPNGGSESVNNFLKVITHARDKDAEIAVAYQKYGTHSRKTIEAAIKKFSDGRFGENPKTVIVVTKDGRIHRHDVK